MIRDESSLALPKFSMSDYTKSGICGINFALENKIIETIPLRHPHMQSQNLKKAWCKGSSESLNK